MSLVTDTMGQTIKSFDRDILERKREGGCLLVAGFPFFVAGLFLLVMALEFVVKSLPRPYP